MKILITTSTSDGGGRATVALAFPVIASGHEG